MSTPKQESVTPEVLKELFTDKKIIFCTDDSAYGFVIGLSDKNIVKINSNYKTSLGNPDKEKVIRRKASQRLNLEKYDETLEHAETLSSILTLHNNEAEEEAEKEAASILASMSSKEVGKDAVFNTRPILPYVEMAENSVNGDSWEAMADIKAKNDAAAVAKTLSDMKSIQDKGEKLTALKESLISYKKNQNERDIQYEARTHYSYSYEDNPSIPRFMNYGLFDKSHAKDILEIIKTANEDSLPNKCFGFRGLLHHLNTVEDPTKPKTRTGFIIMESVGDLTLDDVVNGHYSDNQYSNLKQVIPGGQHLLDNFTEDPLSKHILGELYKAKGRALLLTYMCLGLLHGDAHLENIRIDSTTGQFYLIDFGASIQFQRHHNIPGNTELEKKGHYTRHIPLYLKTDSNTMFEFEKLDEKINDWIKFMTVSELGIGETRRGTLYRKEDDSPSDTTTSKDNEKFGSESAFYEYYKRLPIAGEEASALPFHMLETDHALKLLKYTILKANPRQNGELLHWETINENGPEHYREGYKWIVENLPSNWQKHIHLMLLQDNKDNDNVRDMLKDMGLNIKEKEEATAASAAAAAAAEEFKADDMKNMMGRRMELNLNRDVSPYGIKKDKQDGGRTRRKKRKGRRKTHKKQKKRTRRHNKKIKRRRTRHK
tara:strand:+ start:416 stop:2389 length:1974 start_codon:yes stop_codon:yes gene_type:complete